MKLPPQVVLPEDAIKPRNANSVYQNQVTQDQDRNQGFHQADRNAWGPTRGCGARNFRGQGQRGQGQMRGLGQVGGQGHVWGQGCLSQPNKCKTLQQMVNLLADILQ